MSDLTRNQEDFVNNLANVWPSVQVEPPAVYGNDAHVDCGYIKNDVFAPKRHYVVDGDGVIKHRVVK